MRCSGGTIAVAPQTSLRLANCLLADNGANCSVMRGAVVHAAGSVDIRSCTLANNSGGGVGGVLYVSDGGNATVVNSVFWSVSPDVVLDPTGVAAVTYSCMSTSGWGAGTQLLTASPFTELSPTYRLSMSSSCIDTGSNGAVPPDAFDKNGDGNRSEPMPTDLADRTRFVRDVDCGSYEKQ